MSSLLLDTNIVTYTSTDTSWAKEYGPILQNQELFISFVTLAELLEAKYRANTGERRLVLYKRSLESRYLVIHSDEMICDRFAWIRSERRQKPISVPDALIAATALAYDLPLVTHNARDFEGINGLEIITKYQTPQN